MPAINLAERTLYLNEDINYIKDTLISEYDIKSAGFSVIKYKKLLPDDIIEKLENMNKLSRNIQIGLYMREQKTLAKEINDTLAEVRKEFIIQNNLEEEDILSIKKDAIFVIRKKPTNLLIFGYFQFRPKDVFTSYMNLNNKEFYYSSLDKSFLIKGLSETRDYMYGEKIDDIDYDTEPLLKDIKHFMALAEKISQDALYGQLLRYRHKYLNKELEKKTYRNLLTGYYDLVNNNFKLKDIDNELMKDLDISYNYVNYILPMINCLI